MSTELYVGAFAREYTSVHEIGMDIPSVLKAIARAAKVKQTGLGDLIGVSQPQISRYMKGSKPGKDAYDKIMDAARRYGVLSDDLGSEDVAAGLSRGRDPARRLRVKGSVGAGGQALLYSEGQGDHGSIPAADNDPPGAVAALIVGTSLGLFFDGWYAIYDNVRDPLTDDLIGKLCIVGLEDGRVLIKKVVRNGRRLDLLSNKEDEPAIEDARIAWAAKVTDVRQK